jgi:hypothetical protein
MGDPTADDAARKERRREYQRKYRAANRERLLAAKREWWAANRDRVSAEKRERYATDPVYRQEMNDRNNAYREGNPQQAREYHRAYYEANGERVRAHVREYAAANREKISEDQARRYAANPDRWWASGIKRRHGIDAAGWARMWQKQDGLCYLCGRELDAENTRKTHVEHWHGCVAHDPEFSCDACRRGLACNGCNLILGIIQDDPDRLRAIADKLEEANRSVQERQLKAPQQLMLELG